MQARQLYILSGLGADERVFQQIDFTPYIPVFIQWEIPDMQDTIEHYGKKLITQITSPDPVIIGLSFGGLMAIEIAKQINTDKVILISSAKNKYEIPYYFRLAGRSGLLRYMPIGLLKFPNFITSYFFGANSRHDRQILRQVLFDTDIRFLKWAIDKIANWKNTTILKNVTHIHGTSDRVLPYRYVKCDIAIVGGGHLMVLNKAKEIEKILKQEIEKK